MITTHEPSTNQILSVNSEYDIEQTIEVTVRAFQTDPTARWLFPTDEVYHSAFPGFARAYAACAIANKEVHYLNDFSGAAFWQAPDSHADDGAVIEILEEFIQGRHLEEAFELFEKVEACHPVQPHWYLPILGVDPNHQNGGLGSKLISRQLAICDQTGLPAYLESSNPANLNFYERHGFKILDEINAGTSPSLYPMLREAKSI